MKSPAKFCKCRGCHRRLNAYDDKRSDKLLQVGEVQSEALSPWGLGSGASKDIWRSNYYNIKFSWDLGDVNFGSE